MNYLLKYSNTPELESTFLPGLNYKVTNRDGYTVTAPVHNQSKLNLFELIPKLPPDVNLSKLKMYMEEMYFLTPEGNTFVYSCKDKNRLRRFVPVNKNLLHVATEKGTIELTRVVLHNSYDNGQTMKLNGVVSFNNKIDYHTGIVDLDFSFTERKGKDIKLIGVVVYLSDA